MQEVSAGNWLNKQNNTPNEQPQACLQKDQEASTCNQLANGLTCNRLDTYKQEAARMQPWMQPQGCLQ
jgi:hypothetical protein